MTHIAVIGAGITGVTTAYSLLRRGYTVTVFDRQRYAAMETSYANGGQLSASNAEVWTHWSTIFKGLKWMLRSDAPLLVNPMPSWHKYSWMAEFLASIPQYEANTIATARLAIAARSHMFAIAEREGIDFDLEKRGILHFYTTKKDFDHATRVNAMLAKAGLDRRAVTPQEMADIEPTLTGDFHAGYYTESDSTGDIHKFTRGLARVCRDGGVTFVHEAAVERLVHDEAGVTVHWREQVANMAHDARFDAVVVSAGVGSRELAAQVGDRVNVYPVKGYSITVEMPDRESQASAPWVSLLDDNAKIVTSRLGPDRFRVAGTAEFNGFNRDIRADRIRPLVEWVERYFPGVDTSKSVPWAGLRPMMPNMMPRVGAGKRERVFYNTGHGHLGWTLSAATAELVGDAVLRQIAPDKAGPVTRSGAMPVLMAAE